jgi:NitT/TauT family transport system substrate-binding protein
MIDRRRFLSSSALAAFGVFAGAAQAQKKTELRVSLIPILDIAPFQAAMKQGYFAEAGLSVDGTPSQGGAAGIPALIAGNVQIAFSNIVSILQGAERGFPLRIIAQAMETMGTPPDSAGIVALKKSGITTGADLNGKRVAVNTRNNIIWLYARHWIDQTGGNSETVSFVEVPFPQMPDALIGGQVAAAMVSQPYLGSVMQNPDVKSVAWPYSFEGKQTATSFYVMTSEVIARDPQAVSNFVGALNRGIDWANANYHTPAYVDLVSDYTRIPKDKLVPIFETPWEFKKSPDIASIETIAQLMLKYGLLKSAPDVSKILYPSKA